MNYPWHQEQWQRIQTAADANRLPHAILLTGMEGLAMVEFVEQLIRYLLCDGTAQDEQVKRLLKAGTHPDVVWVKPEEKGKQIKVEAIRELISFIQLSSQSGKYKIAIIRPAEAMNRHAANALLKTLEEPPGRSLLILLSHHPAKLAITIRSRCQNLPFSAVDKDTALAWLAAEKLSLEHPVELLELAQGAPLKALELQENGTLLEFRQVIADLIALKDSRTEVLAIAEKWLGYDTSQLFQWLLAIFSKSASLKCVGFSGLEDKSQINKDLHHLSNGLDLSFLIDCYDKALTAYHAATGPYNLNKQGQLEEFIVYWQLQFN